MKGALSIRPITAGKRWEALTFARQDSRLFESARLQENFEPIIKPKNASQFPEVVRARAPRGFSDAVKEAAKARQLSTSEFVRRALAEKIHAKSTRAS